MFLPDTTYLKKIRLSCLKVSCHIQDIPENGADVAHLDAVHRATIVAGGEPAAWLERLLSWTYHEWAIEWRPMEEVEGKEAMRHCAQVKLRHKMTLFGKLNLLNLKVSN